MRPLILALLFTLFANNVAQAGCEDVKEATGGAAQKRTEKTKDIYNAGMPNPEDYRSNIGNCLDIIVNAGDIFSMGVIIPNMDTLLKDACQAVSAEVNGAINDALNQAKQRIEEAAAPYKVSGDPGSVAKDVLSELKK